VELDGTLPKSSSTSALSGAGLMRLFNFVGDSIGKYTYTMSEPDDVRERYSFSAMAKWYDSSLETHL